MEIERGTTNCILYPEGELTTPPILAFPACRHPFKLHTDACQTGLGAALYQTQNELEKVIDYACRGLSRSEKNYPTHKLEFLELIEMGCHRNICRLSSRERIHSLYR